MALLAAAPVDLLVSGIGLPDADVTEVLALDRAVRPFRRVVVVATLQQEWLALCLSRLSLDAVVDSSRAGDAALDAALLEGVRGDGSGCPFPAPAGGSAGSLFRAILTRTEQLVLVAICDGCDDTQAAERLAMSSGAVLSVRRRLHHKLGVQTRSELVGLAGKFGLVHFSHEGAVRTGFKLLRDGMRRPMPEPRPGTGCAESSGFVRPSPDFVQ